MNLIKLFKKPHPFIFNTFSVLIVGGITFLIVFMFAPFGLAALPVLERVGFGGLFGGVAASCVFGVVKALKYIFPVSLEDENWTLGKEIGLVFFVLTLINFVLFLFFIFLTSSQNLLELFQVVFIRTLLIAFFPILILILYEQYHHQKIKWKEVQLLNQTLQKRQIKLQEKQTRLKTEYEAKFQNHQIQVQKQIQTKLEELENTIQPKKIVLEAENGKIALQLQSSEILYLQAEGNYIEVFYQLAHTIKKELIRNSLKKLEEILPKEIFFRCHKSYIVNLSQIQKVEGNARNFELILQNSATKIPVSRSKSQELSELLKSK